MSDEIHLQSRLYLRVKGCIRVIPTVTLPLVLFYTETYLHLSKISPNIYYLAVMSMPIIDSVIVRVCPS